MPSHRRSIWLKRIVLLILFSVSTHSAVSAQTSRGAQPNLEATLIPGMTVWITDSGEHEEKTRIVRVSGDVVTITDGDDIRSLRTADVMRVRVRRSDPV